MELIPFAAIRACSRPKLSPVEELGSAGIGSITRRGEDSDRQTETSSALQPRVEVRNPRNY